ncbi:hypothetical protein NMY22_g3750 [Coprinellus aureogranulatus]|nr:hypothetical protein NMY22_g3750 [Coprinellus aureogranulatus]
MLETLLTYASPLLQYDIVVRTLFQVLRWVYWPLNDLLKRVDNSPGLPVPNPTSPYWMHPPSPIAQLNAPGSKGKNIPEYADIVIIGSGITGTSFARTILDHGKGNDVHGKPLNVVMLEARDACSGATGRRKHGKDMAQKIIRFRLSHLEQLLQVAEEEGLLDDSQCRRVEAFDVFHDKQLFSEAKAWFREYKEDLPEESRHYKIYETPEEIEALQLSKSTVGCLSTCAGTVHPYRLVTGILSRLLNSYHPNFELFTHTPCTDVKRLDEDDAHQYMVENAERRHSHSACSARNEWMGVSPAARDARKDLPPHEGQHLKVLVPPPNGELMLGGGFAHALVTEIGTADDSQYNPAVREYLSRVLGSYFSVKRNGEKEGKEEVKAVWSGILGISADAMPWVGSLPQAISARGDSGEWIAAGYTGEGMVHAWMSGKALAFMVLGEEVDSWFPEVFRISEKRWKRARFSSFVGTHV